MKNLSVGLAVVALIVGLFGLFSGLSAQKEARAVTDKLADLDTRVTALSDTSSRVEQDVRGLHAQTASAFQQVGTELQSLRQELTALTAAREAAAAHPAAAVQAGDSNKPKPTAKTSGRKHKVAEGDTLQRIANRYNTSLQAVLDANPGIDPKRVRIGQDVYLP